MMLAAVLVAASWAGAIGSDWEALAQRQPDAAWRGDVLAALEAESGELDGAAQTLAFNAGTGAAEAFELERAVAIFEQLTARLDAGWARYNLALARHRAGDGAGAEAALDELLATVPAAERPALWSQRAIFALGAGRTASARASFGHAIGLGDADAASILAREALARHNLGPARRGFRSALARRTDHPWALRGWGLTLLSDHDSFPNTPSNRTTN